MTPLDLALTRFLLASLGCLAAGAGVWGALALCRRWLPALALQRSTWLLAQLAVAASLAVLMLPHGDGLRVTPVIELDAGEPAPTAAAAPALPEQATDTLAAAAAPTHFWLADAARAWCLLYLLGLGHALWRWRRAQRLLDALARSGDPLAANDGHAGLDAAAGKPRPPAVIEVDTPIAPMLLGLFRPRLLLPRHLRAWEPLQQQLIVAHELTHWRRRDLAWMTAGLALQTVFWFNPVMRMLRERLCLAQELGCDREVLSGRPASQRKAYAAALLAQLKLQHQPCGTALAFGASGAFGKDALAARIALIRDPARAARAPWVRAAALGSLAAAFLASLAVQPALAWRGDARSALPGAGPLDCTDIADAATGQALVRNGSCAASVPPGSTFKIAISLMGYDSGVLADAHAPRLPFRRGYVDYVPSWRHATDPAGWMRDSVVWYSQQVTRRLGAARVQDYVDRFGYGNRDLSGLAGVDDLRALSELSPTLRISPDGQTAFLRRLVTRSLPVSGRAVDMTARLLALDAQVDGWTVYGKTGTPAAAGSDGRAQGYGWFVGWATKGSRTLVFARLLQAPTGAQDHGGALAKAAFLRELAQRSASL